VPPVRDQLVGHLLTPDYAALLIGYQPVQLAGARSMDRMLLVKNDFPVATRPRS
jgi:hypothetical protein